MILRVRTCGAISVLIFMLVTVARAAMDEANSSIVIHWNRATLQGIRDAKLGAPMVARSLTIVHTCNQFVRLILILFRTVLCRTEELRREEIVRNFTRRSRDLNPRA